MPKKWTHTGAFAHFGAVPRNVQWSWSARAADGTVVVTLWQDQFVKSGHGTLTYTRPGFDPAEPDTRPGFRELMDNLDFALRNNDGRFRVIVAKAKDPDTHPRSIERCFPSDMTMKLIALDRDDGSFTAETVRQQP